MRDDHSTSTHSVFWLVVLGTLPDIFAGAFSSYQNLSVCDADLILYLTIYLLYVPVNLSTSQINHKETPIVIFVILSHVLRCHGRSQS